MGVEYCNDRVCLWICLSASISQKPHTNFTNFSVHVARERVVIRYLLPVLWITSCFPIMNYMATRCCCSSLAAVSWRPNTPAACCWIGCVLYTNLFIRRTVRLYTKDFDMKMENLQQRREQLQSAELRLKQTILDNDKSILVRSWPN